jgi:cysteine synthase A
VKLESENPGGSVKDRLAVGVIEWAEQNGQLKPGQTVVEATSGNTGIGLAMVCARKGYPFVCVMAESFSIERRKLMRFLGARVVLTNPAHKGTGMVIKAKELADKHGWFFPNQFDNEANAWIHEMTTGPEIVNAFEDANVKLDHFVLAYGSGGTLKGVAKVLRERSPDTKIHVCEPDNAPMIYSGIETLYPESGTPSTSFHAPHPVWRPHLFQGWAADFIPKLVCKADKSEYIDEVIHPGGDDAINTSRALAAKEGIFSGTSGGGVLACAIKIAETAPEGTSILAIIPDTGERYLSTPLFDNIPADMTEEEKALAESTPSTPPPPPDLPGVLPEAIEFVKKTNTQNKVVFWSLQYCEFCWTLKKLLDAAGVPYEAINIDSFEYAKDQMGNKYRAALCDMTDCNTFPQLFINGEFVGGAVDACMMWKGGEVQTRLNEAGVEFVEYEGDPFEFLPKWMSQNPLRSK